MNAFESLEIPVRLLLSDEEVKLAYDSSPKEETHLSARNTLLNPAARLESWMEHYEIPKARHASIPAELIPLFSELSELINGISQLAQKRKEASTLLAQTLLDKQLFEKKPRLDDLAKNLANHRQTALSKLPELEEIRSSESANIVLQTLKFIQKWERELDKSYTQLL